VVARRRIREVREQTLERRQRQRAPRGRGS
jgi:hypothetical protein